jgi:hypothetical protein
MSGNGKPKDVTSNLDQLLKVLRSLSSQRDVLDKKLADYIFFPLSSVLKQLEKLPLQAKELTFECILVLLQTAWARDLPSELGMQLLILITFVLDQDATRKSEELSTVLFKSMGLIMTSLGSGLVTTQSIPHLGKGVSLILEDGVLKGPSEEVQTAAVGALDAFCHAVKDKDALGTSFLPGIMSCLAKSLSGQGAKVSANVMAAALQVLTYLLPLLFNDAFVSKLPDDDGGKGLSQKWLKATVPQVKMALANILKLQAHDRQNVRLALGKLCTALLQDCSTSMADSLSMLLEANLTLATQEETLEAELRHLLTTSTTFAETLQSSLHYWIMSLPRLMDSADETKKQRRVRQITLSFRMLNEQGVDMSMINRNLASNLRDSVAGAIRNPKKKGNAVAVMETSLNMSLDIVRSHEGGVQEFDPIIALQRSQMDTVKDLSSLAQAISSNDSSLAAAQDLISSIYNNTGDLQLSSFWLVLNMVRSALNSSSDIDVFLNFSSSTLDAKTDLLEQLYDFALSILSDTSGATEVDWRLQALSLETIALQATQQGEAFRPELVDALYPILHTLGSSHPSLRSHAITTLNILSTSCAYPSTSDLVIDNVDYLVNAVALRLNMFEVSPQAPMVLMMMVRLAGGRLLPYLDDTVEAVFVALESFHGYPRLVDLLFRCLKVIVEEGARADVLAITEGEKEGRKTIGRRGISMDDVVRAIEDMRRRYEALKAEDEELTPVPEEPWGDEQKSGNKAEDGDGNAMSTEQEDAKPPAPRTYSILLNISNLTQHYLTASSPELRTSLLDLLSSSFPALAKHENSFLPLIHTLWPVLLPRLEDSEPYVVAGSLRIVGLMCKYGGDFMAGRVDEAWAVVRRVWRTRTGRAGNPGQRSGGVGRKADIASIVSVGNGKSEVAQSASQQQHYIDAPSRIIWEALVEALVNIVTYTATSDVIFDDMVDILAPILATREDVRNALETRNADAVWLALFRLGAEHGEVVQPQVPAGSDRWTWGALR